MLSSQLSRSSAGAAVLIGASFGGAGVGGLWMRCGEQGWRQRWQLLRLRVDAAECAAGTEIVVLPVRQYGRRRVGNLAAEDHLGNILICTARLAFGDPKLKSKPDRYIV